MTRAFIADTRPEERSALRLMLLDMKLDVVGESGDWATTQAELPAISPELLLVDWDLLPAQACAALDRLRKGCPATMAIVLISRYDARHQAALSSGADVFISTGDMAERVADRLGEVAASVQAGNAVISSAFQSI